MNAVKFKKSYRTRAPAKLSILNENKKRSREKFHGNVLY